DQILMILPRFRLAAYFLLFLFANWKIDGTMKSNAHDIESCGASGGGNDELILSIERSKPRTDGSNQTTFSCAAFSKHSQPQLRTDLGPPKSVIWNGTKDASMWFSPCKLTDYLHNRPLVLRTVGE